MVTLRIPDWISITVVHKMMLGFSMASMMVFNMLMVGSGGASTNINSPRGQ